MSKREKERKTELEKCRAGKTVKKEKERKGMWGEREKVGKYKERKKGDRNWVK